MRSMEPVVRARWARPCWKTRSGFSHGFSHGFWFQPSQLQELPLDSFRASELPDPEELVSARRAKLQEAKAAVGVGDGGGGWGWGDVGKMYKKLILRIFYISYHSSITTQQLFIKKSITVKNVSLNIVDCFIFSEQYQNIITSVIFSKSSLLTIDYLFHFSKSSLLTIYYLFHF